MRAIRALSIAAVATSATFAAAFVPLRHPVAAPAPPHVGPADIGGTVTGPKGPEAGVWVIAETSEVPTKYAKVFDTDDGDRDLNPDPTRRSYSVIMHDIGRVHTQKRHETQGGTLALRPVQAARARALDEYYPAGCWYT